MFKNKDTKNIIHEHAVIAFEIAESFISKYCFTTAIQFRTTGDRTDYDAFLFDDLVSLDELNDHRIFPEHYSILLSHGGFDRLVSASHQSI
jgi:hypothetical protein